jgi:hypothetical protein
VKLKTESLHRPRLRQPSTPSVCVPEAAYHQATVFFTPTARSLNKSADASANFVGSTLSASNSERFFEAGAVKTESPWHQLASLFVDLK